MNISVSQKIAPLYVCPDSPRAATDSAARCRGAMLIKWYIE